MKKVKKKRAEVIGEAIGRIIVFALTFIILVAVFSMVLLVAYGFIMLMKGVFNGF